MVILFIKRTSESILARVGSRGTPIAIAIPSVCLSVALVVHVLTVQDIEIGFAPYDILVFENFSRGILWSYV